MTEIQKGLDGKEAADKLRRVLEMTDTVIVGAGAGLSSSAGFSYTEERFYKYFRDFADKYHFSDMYTGGFYPYDSMEEYWAYWSRYILINRYTAAPRPVYDKLLSVIKKKDYFVLTTNVDHQFQRAGFDKQRLFYTQGDYGLFQCSEPCCQKTYDNEAVIRQMTERQQGMRIPFEWIPYCPVCGKPMTMNLRSDQTFVEDEGWHKASKRYAQYLEGHRHTRTLFLELGCGFNTPGIIKYSFWKMAAEWTDAVYACVNKGEAFVPGKLADKSVCINDDIGNILMQL